jgi:hypothetical protein
MAIEADKDVDYAQAVIDLKPILLGPEGEKLLAVARSAVEANQELKVKLAKAIEQIKAQPQYIQHNHDRSQGLLNCIDLQADMQRLNFYIKALQTVRWLMRQIFRHNQHSTKSPAGGCLPMARSATRIGITRSRFNSSAETVALPISVLPIIVNISADQIKCLFQGS